MKNRKGFTLVELLITIVIMGIITAIAIPLLRNARERNNEKQYTTYADSLKHAAKLYLDSYEEDMFGRQETGCAIITYNQLKSRNLIKDIPIENITCDVSETYVKVVKINGKYGYSTSLVCGNKNADGTFSETARYPKEGISDSDVCGESASTIMSIEVEPAPPQESNTYKRRNLDIKISSDTGINLNPVISYGFSLSSNTSEPQLIDGWKQLDLSVPALDKQIKDIEAGYTIVVKSNKITTPELLSGDYYLIVKVEDLRDASGNIWNKDSDNHDSIIAFGTYRLDNTPPLFNDSAVISSNETYNAKIPKLDLKATDNFSTDSQMKMCVSYEEDTCDKSLTAVKNYSPYDSTKELQEISSVYDGSTHKIYVTIADAAGNYNTKEFSYTVDIEYNIEYSLDSGTHGTSHPTLVKGPEQFTVSKPTKSVKMKFTVGKGITINYTGAGVSASGQSKPYTFNGWNITNMTNSLHYYGALSATEESTTGRTETTFKSLRNTVGTVNFNAKWKAPTVKLPAITKTGHICKWVSDGHEWASGENYVPLNSGGATQRTFTANCTPKTYTVTYNCGSSGSNPPASQTIKYGEKFTINSKKCTSNRNGIWQSNNRTWIDSDSVYWDKSNSTNWTWTYDHNVTLYANWVGTKLYVSISSNGGTWCGSNYTDFCPSNAKLQVRRSTGCDDWMRYDYNYNIGASEPGHGFIDMNASDNVCWYKSGYHVVYDREYNTQSNGRGSNISQQRTDYYTQDWANLVGCDLSKQDCTINLYVNWVRN